MPYSRMLGKLISTHGTSPAFLQRAAIVAGLSFVFFFVMLVAFYLRQQIGYFILSTAFLVVNLFTLIGWLMQKRNVAKVYENGFRYRKTIVFWDQISSATLDEPAGLTITKLDEETLIIPGSIDAIDKLASYIREQIR